MTQNFLQISPFSNIYAVRWTLRAAGEKISQFYSLNTLEINEKTHFNRSQLLKFPKFSGLRPNKCYLWSHNPVFLFYMKFYMKYFHVEFHVEFFKTVHVEFYMSHVEKKTMLTTYRNALLNQSDLISRT